MNLKIGLIRLYIVLPESSWACSSPRAPVTMQILTQEVRGGELGTASKKLFSDAGAAGLQDHTFIGC